MKKRLLIALLVCVVLTLYLGVASVQAQDAEVSPVSGTYNYSPQTLAVLEHAGYTYMDAIDTEEYFGDFEGTATSIYPAIIEPSGLWEAPIITEFEGTVLGEYEGTMTIVYIYRRMSPTAEWFGNWWIMGGTGDLENIGGRGVVWGPGWLPDNPEAEPDVYYSGNVFFYGEGANETTILQLTFDGESCTYEGPTELAPGAVELIFINDSDAAAAVNFVIHDEGYSIQDMIDQIGEEPSMGNTPWWVKQLGTWRTVRPDETIMHWNGDLEPGIYTMVCSRMTSPIGVWFGTGLTVTD